MIEEKLARIRFTVDAKPHIKVDGAICDTCSERPCLYACPVQNYRLTEESSVEFLWQACLECGACRIVCIKGAVEWNYPRGGYGVSYRYG